MPVHIAESVLGVFAFDDMGKLVSFRKFPHDPIEVAGKIASVQMGTPTEEHRQLISELMTKGHREFTLESKSLAGRLKEEFKRAKFEILIPNVAGSILREKLQDIVEDLGFEKLDDFVREVNFILTRHKLRTEAAQRDSLIIQSIGLLDDIDKFANILIVRVREWYSIHFPELDRLVQDHEIFLKLITKIGLREDFTKEAVINATGISEEKAEKITRAAAESLGAHFDETDLKSLKRTCKEIFELYDLRNEISEYIDGLMAQIAPNLRAVVGSAIGARLIAIAGGLQELSRMPASTIQVLGAEKALFRALKRKGSPPKHGVIFQYPEVRGSPKKLRGKIARALAGKVAIAARVDAMSGEFVGDKLDAELKARISDIKRKARKEL
ncbi:MAG: C/D box methylation guide ribonucleoprotein complex aNOP56 subunit [Candidatus Hadarchaeum sp.]|uniref:C/D box methylation guide ribonucleoprotein complex aNOP56 subunit n=1 Tax=Candidatus Hadarchaeum sp. TaxID=2883567 RepID=UPI003D0DEC61